MTDNAKPLVSIGFPVYNAGSTLARALESLIAQDYPNFELIISDNASTDDTAGICLALAARDSRVTYIRQPENMGYVWNFNHVVGLARGKYFVRMSHDDVRGPSYVSKCVALLEKHPGAVLSHSYTGAFYGELSNVLCILTHDTIVGIRNPRVRFLRALSQLPASALDGMFRTVTLREHTRLLEAYLASDIVLIHELSLHGEFVQVPEVLFWRSGKPILPPPQEITRRFGYVMSATRWKLPFVVVLINHLRSIRRSSLSGVDKALLCLQVIAHELRQAIVKTGFRAVTVVIGHRCPVWLLRWAIALTEDNPNVRILKHPRDLPPVLHPTWRLLNHRDMDKALLLQQKLDAKLYLSRA